MAKGQMLTSYKRREIVYMSIILKRDQRTVKRFIDDGKVERKKTQRRSSKYNLKEGF